jgi:hypothetical protein
VEAEIILVKKMLANALQINHSSQIQNALSVIFQNILILRLKFAQTVLNTLSIVLILISVSFVLYRNHSLMEKNVYNVRQIHFTTDLLSHVKDVVLEEYTILRKTNANVKIQHCFSMVPYVSNAITQDILIILITYARYAQIIKYTISHLKNAYLVLKKLLILMVNNVLHAQSNLFGIQILVIVKHAKEE